MRHVILLLNRDRILVGSRGILDFASLHPGYELRAASYRSVRDEELIGGEARVLDMRKKFS